VRTDELVAAIDRAMNPVAAESNVLYLTFDDFPAASGNTALLDALRAVGVRATFFVIGENAERDPDSVQRAIDEGHTIAVHAWQHTPVGSEPEKCREWLASTFGITARWLRRVGSNTVSEFGGADLTLPVVDPYDYKRPGVNELSRRTVGRLKPGALIQLHAGVEDTVSFLPDLVARARELGYRFEPLPQ
jgi:peptidoglycan/xylan/chitin deacetylase (PgdA/CDA1 family)